MKKQRFIGIDGCRFGWVIALIQDSVQFYLIKSIADFNFLASDSVWIDMPIGLMDSKERSCDKELKKALGKKSASVFMTPVKKAVYAKDYQQASAINAQETGKKLSIQSWNICNKIKELDLFLANQSKEIQQIFKESHPEFLFQSLSKTSFDSKKSDSGSNQRITFLESKGIDLQSIEAFTSKVKKTDCKLDDVLDALILAIASKKSESQTPNFYGDDFAKIYWV